MVLVMVATGAVMVTAGCGGCAGRAVVAGRVAATRRGGCGGRRGRQVMAHGRVVRPGGRHGRRGGPEPVRGVRHLTACGKVAVAHGRGVVHVRGGRGAGQPVEVGLVQVRRVVHDVGGDGVGDGSGGVRGAAAVIARRYRSSADPAGYDRATGGGAGG